MVAFTSAILERRVEGNRRVHTGTWTDGATGANDIDTGLRVVTSMKLQQKGTAVAATAAVIDETFPCDGSAVTIAVPSGDTKNGYWIAEGYI